MRKALFYAWMIIGYLLAYRLYALDRDIVSWIKLTHYVSQTQMLSLLVLAAAAAYALSKTKIHQKPVYVLTTLSILTGLLFFNSPQYNPDSLKYYVVARHIQEQGPISGMVSASELGYADTPVYPLLNAITYFLHEGYLTTQLLHLILYASIPVTIYFIGKELFNQETGYYAGLLALATPTVVGHHQFMLQDLPLTAFTAATVYAFLKAKDDKKWVPPLIIFAALTLTVKVSGIMYLGATLPALALTTHKIQKRDLKKIAALAALACLLIAALVYATPALKERIDKKSSFAEIEKNVKRFFTIGSHTPSLGLPLQLGIPQAILFAVALPYILLHRRRQHIFLASWIILPFLVAHDTKLRYLMPMFPAVSLIAAQGLNWVKDRRESAYFAAFAMLFISAYTMPQLAHDYAAENMRTQAMAADTLPGETLAVFSQLNNRYNPKMLAALADLYSSKEIRYLGVKPVDRKRWREYKEMLTLLYGENNQTTKDMDAILKNYTLVSESEGAIWTQRNPHTVRLYQLRDGMQGPADLILYATDATQRNENVYYSFYPKIGACNSQKEQYCYGPVCLSGKSYRSREQWLGEKQVLMKPPQKGQLNCTRRMNMPENASLSFGVSLRPDTWHPLKGDGVTFKVYVNCSSSSQKIYERYIDPKNDPRQRKIFYEQVKLDACAGEKTLFTFATDAGPKASSIYDTAGWADPRITLI